MPQGLCENCKKKLTADEIILYMKIISRTDKKYLCLSCQAEYFGCSEEFLKKKIRHFKAIGCLLFIPENEGE